MRVLKRVAGSFPLTMRTPLLEGATQVPKYTTGLGMVGPDGFEPSTNGL